MSVSGADGASLMKNIRSRMDVVALMALIVAAGYSVGTLLTLPGLRWPLLLIAALGVSLAFGIVLMRIGRSPGADERLVKILAWAGRNTFLTSIALLAGLALLNDAGLLPGPTIGIGEALKGGLVILVALFALWYAYYFVRGDTE